MSQRKNFKQRSGEQEQGEVLEVASVSGSAWRERSDLDRVHEGYVREISVMQRVVASKLGRKYLKEGGLARTAVRKPG